MQSNNRSHGGNDQRVRIPTDQLLSNWSSFNGVSHQREKAKMQRGDKTRFSGIDQNIKNELK
jgi:hypothetical protein